MQSVSYAESGKSVRSSIGKRGLTVLAVLFLAFAVNATDVDRANSGILGGALIGTGVGAIFGGAKGAVVGAIGGGLLGALSEKKKGKKRRW